MLDLGSVAQELLSCTILAMTCTAGKFIIATFSGPVFPLVAQLVLLLYLELLIAILMNLEFADDIGQTCYMILIYLWNM